MKRKLKIYKLDTKLEFGMYKGKRLSDIVRTRPAYITWCILNLDYFLINPDLIEKYKQINSRFYFSKNCLEKLEEKWDLWDSQDDHNSYNKEGNEWWDERPGDDECFRDAYGV